MAYRIVLDAGHGGQETGSAYLGRNEKDDNLKLALAVGKILEGNGVEVVYTRTADEYLKPKDRAGIVNKSKGDYLISLHRNVSSLPNTRSGVTSLVFDLHGNKMDMIKSISSELEKVGYEDLGVLVTPEYIILGRTVIPSLLLQVGFIDNENDNMIFDTRFNEVAQAIADGILTTLGESNKAIPALYRVQVGVFNQKENAEALLKSLHDQGYPAFLAEEDGSYKVQVGAYAELENAAKMEAFLRSQGYSTYITT